MENNPPKPSDAEIKKQNMDFPNVPASTDEQSSGETLKKEIHKTSKLHDDGKTDNTEKNED